MDKEEKYLVKGMTCSSCVAHVEKAVRKVKGVKEVSVSLLTNSMVVTKEDSVTDTDIETAVKNAGYEASKEGKEENKKQEKDDETKNMILKLTLSILLLIPLFYIGMGYMLNMQYEKIIFPLGAFGENEFFIGLTEMALSFTIMIINKKFFTSGFRSILHLQPNMDTLVALGSSVSFLYSFIMLFVMAFYAKENNFNEVMKASMNLSFETAGMVPTLISIGKTLETYSKGKTTNAIKELLDLAPRKAHLLKEGKSIEIDAANLQTNDIFLVLPGESFPADGIIIEGSSSVDESALSGESLPIDKTVNDKVSAATNNLNGALTCKATKVGNETTLHQIVKMVEEASSTKTKISQIADKVAGVFVPIVMTISLIVFLFWLLLGNDFVSSLNDGTTTLTYAINKAISVLVISCPCALGLATPVAIMVGNGKGAKNGILFKTASTLEETSKIDYIVLDKTGTITKGKPTVTGIHTNLDLKLFLSIFSSLESKSEHPLSKAILEKAKEEGIETIPCTSFMALSGHGIQGSIDGKNYFAGNKKLMEERKISLGDYSSLAEKEAADGKTPLFLAEEGKILGVIFVSDPIKEDSKEAIDGFKKLGILPIMLTGDNRKTALAIAKKAGIDQVISDVLPDGKLKVIKELQKHGKVAMVGDGINDAPSLTQADIGIAIGAGSDIAIKSADIVLTKSTLMDALKAILLSKHVLRNIKENLFWAFFYNIIMIPIAAGAFSAIGLAKLRPWMGAAAMALSSLFVVLNALRINLFSFKLRSGSKKIKAFPENLTQPQSKEEITKVIEVKDMMCENCVKHVKEALEKLEQVQSCEVSLKDLNATIALKEDISDDRIRKTIVEAGYQPGIIKTIKQEKKL